MVEWTTIGLLLGAIVVLAAIYISRASIVAATNALYTWAAGNQRTAVIVFIVIIIAVILAIQKLWFWMLVGAAITAIGVLVYAFRAQIGGTLSGIHMPARPAWLHVPTTPRGWIISVVVVLVAGLVIAAAIFGVQTLSNGGEEDDLAPHREEPLPTPTPIVTPTETQEAFAFTNATSVQNTTQSGSVVTSIGGKEAFGVGYSHTGTGNLVDAGTMKAEYMVDGKKIVASDENIIIPPEATNTSAKGAVGFCGSTGNIEITQEGCKNLIAELLK